MVLNTTRHTLLHLERVSLALGLASPREYRAVPAARGITLGWSTRDSVTQRPQHEGQYNLHSGYNLHN